MSNATKRTSQGTRNEKRFCDLAVSVVMGRVTSECTYLGANGEQGHGENQSLKNPATKLHVKRSGHLLCTKEHITKPVFIVLFLRLSLVCIRINPEFHVSFVKVHSFFFKGRTKVLTKKRKSVSPKTNPGVPNKSKHHSVFCYFVTEP